MTVTSDATAYREPPGQHKGSMDSVDRSRQRSLDRPGYGDRDLLGLSRRRAELMVPQLCQSRPGRRLGYSQSAAVLAAETRVPRGDRRLDMTGSRPGDQVDPSLINLETAVVKERAAGVLAEHHQIEVDEARWLLFVLAGYRGLSPNVMAAQVPDSEAARRAAIPDPPQRNDLAPE